VNEAGERQRAFDAVVIGGGHNGLTCAAYLAAAGQSVCVLERRAVLGGAAVTEEFHPGFRNSTASYTVSLLNPKVIHELRLAEHGLEIIPRPLANFLPLPDGGYLKVGGGIAATQAEVAKYSARDAQRLPEYYAMLDRVAWCAPRARAGDTAQRGTRHRRDARGVEGGEALPRARHRWAARRARPLHEERGEVLDRWFESAPIKAAFGFDAVVGNYASPYTPGSAYVLLHHVFGEVNGVRGQWGHARGGMGAITQAMAAECAVRGVTLRTGAAVARVVVVGGKATGVELGGGEIVRARRVIANVNPKLLFQQLVAPDHLPADFLARIDGYRCGSGTFRMNVALSELPDFTVRPGKNAQPHHGSGIIIAPSLAYMERAYFDARTDGWSAAPIVELLLPSVVDDSLAPPWNARRESLLPARASGSRPSPSRAYLGRCARRSGRPDARYRQSRRAEFQGERARPPGADPARSRARIRLGRWRHLPRRARARPALLRATRAGTRQLPLSGPRSLHVRRRHAPRRRRHGRARAQRGTRNPEGCAAAEILILPLRAAQD
jgi:phytoene dehydrogenase-like protein